MRRRVLVRVLLFGAVLGAGVWLRTLEPSSLPAGLAAWRPWPATAIVHLYFADGPFLFPVSRQVPATGDLPRAALEALLAGPEPASGLRSAIPDAVAIRSVRVSDGVARIDLSRAFLDHDADPSLAVTAITGTMTEVPGVSAVAISVEGEPLDDPGRTTFLYYPSARGLVAIPASPSEPRAALDLFLSGPPAHALTGLPPDVQLVTYDFDATAGLVSLGFTYTESMRTLALEAPTRVRHLLLGLIATLTEHPTVRAVRLDFGGQSRLGLGECSDLLRTHQPRPALLNDERLLGT